MPRVTRRQLMAEIGAATSAYQRATQALDDEVGRRLGVNAADLRGLDWLTDQPRTASELARRTGLTPAATTSMIDRLERKGFVRRTSDPGDRRRVLVEMTEEGQRRTYELYEPMVLEGMPVLDSLSTSELQLLATHLVAIREITERHEDRLRSDWQPPGSAARQGR
ncbi:MarR family winged helix-turn-helix transcriptional regulator [Knoellia subterranea]|uniref:Transcriptional regulator n=1 Tax=Knoellia subterranea KCTC 19937 TaxID=1385521 RepID=A0A0A0JQ99_9MICO|nr:MarR family transcriptional regulator [Knoellia subterranea]KGN38212.1 transcriptional regulator [Knoellia subterranea KCTC 19937]